jgi:hypothetical protein
MNMEVDRSVRVSEGPDGIDLLEREIHDAVSGMIQQIRGESSGLTLLRFERLLWPGICLLYRLFVALFLATRHNELDVEAHSQGVWRVKNSFAIRNLKTQLGIVQYGRAYLTRRNGGGWFPLDAALGITSDGYSWRVVDTVTRLATRVSYGATRGIAKAILGWSPSIESIELLVIGLGARAPAFVETHGRLEDDGEVLVIELDGKAAPMATDSELKARRQKRKRKKCKSNDSCKCQRHRGRKKRKGKRKKPRKRGNNSKNGRSATLVAMYTLRKMEDGKLHGPINKKVWGKFGPRNDMMTWVREQATRRGFGPDTNKTIQVVIDGEPCLRKRMQELFPHAIFTLDIRHPQERLWKLGRLFHDEGSAELDAWIAPLNTLLLDGKIDRLLERLRDMHASIAKRGPGTKAKRNAVAAEIKYLEKRQHMMDYANWRKQDLVMATGIIEGACRYVIGERLDCSGMRWCQVGAERLLQLRCIELNGDWDQFIDWTSAQTAHELTQEKTVTIRGKPPKKQSASPETSAA